MQGAPVSAKHELNPSQSIIQKPNLSIDYILLGLLLRCSNDRELMRMIIIPDFII